MHSNSMRNMALRCGIALIHVTAAAVATATTVTWVGPSVGDWHIASNWSPKFPDANDSVIIGVGRNVTIREFTAQAGSLTVNGPFFLLDGRLHASNGLTFNGAFGQNVQMLQGSLIDGGGGSLSFASGIKLMGDASVNTLRNVNLTSNLDFEGLPTVDGRLRIEGTFTASGSQRTVEASEFTRITFGEDAPGSGRRLLENIRLNAVGGDFATDPGVALHLGANAAMTLSQFANSVSASGIDNAGLIEVSGGFFSDISAGDGGLGLTNRAGGTIQVANAQLRVFAAKFDSAGQIFVNNATIRIDAGQLTHLAHLDVNNGLAAFSGGAIINALGTLNAIDLRNNATLAVAIDTNLGGATLTPNSFSSDNSGNLRLSGGTHLRNGRIANTNRVALTGGGTVTLTDMTIVNGGLTFPDVDVDTTLRLNGNIGALQVIPSFPQPIEIPIPLVVDLGDRVRLSLGESAPGGGAFVFNNASFTIRDHLTSDGNLVLINNATLRIPEFARASFSQLGVNIGGNLNNFGQIFNHTRSNFTIAGHWTNTGLFMHESSYPLLLSASAGGLTNSSSGAIVIDAIGALNFPAGTVQLGFLHNDGGTIRLHGRGGQSDFRESLTFNVDDETRNSGWIEATNHGLLIINTQRFANNAGGLLEVSGGGRIRINASEYEAIAGMRAAGAGSWIELSGSGVLGAAAPLEDIDLTSGAQLRIRAPLASDASFAPADLSSDGTGAVVLIDQSLSGNTFGPGGPGGAQVFVRGTSSFENVSFQNDFIVDNGHLTIRGQFLAERVELRGALVGGVTQRGRMIFEADGSGDDRHFLDNVSLELRGGELDATVPLVLGPNTTLSIRPTVANLLWLSDLTNRGLWHISGQGQGSASLIAVSSGTHFVNDVGGQLILEQSGTGILLQGTFENRGHMEIRATGQWRAVGVLLDGQVDIAPQGSLTATQNVTVVGGTIHNGGFLGSDAGSLSVEGGTLHGAGTFSFPNGVSITGGRMLVHGNATVSTITVHAGGTLGGSGTVASVVVAGGTIAPGGSPGMLNVTGSLSLDASSVLDFELDGLMDANDRIAVGGNLVLDGILNVTNLGGLEAGAYTLLTYGGSLTDNGLALGTTPSGFSFSVDTTSPGSVLLHVSAGLPGDFNGDGAVDAADYVLWRKTGGSQQAYDQWRANFGMTESTGQSGVSTAVPEPASWLLLVLAGAIVGRWRRMKGNRYGVAAVPRGESL